MLTPAVLGQSGKGANRSLFFGAGNGPAQTAKNRSGCLFRSPFLWSLSFGGAKESYIKNKRTVTLGEAQSSIRATNSLIKKQIYIVIPAC